MPCPAQPKRHVICNTHIQNQNMLLFFFFSFSAFVSLCVLNPQKLFLVLACGAAIAGPLPKKLLWLAAGVYPVDGCK